jgi:glycosyltransferase 2 family protein
MLRRLQLVALALGVAFFAYLIYAIGPAAILRDLRSMGWGLVLIVMLELTVDAMNTVGWRFTFPRHERHVCFASLYLVRMAGTAFNQAVPSASVGGEPLKAMLLRDSLPLSSAMASVFTAKLTFSIAQGIFAFVGLLLTFHRLHFPRPVLLGLVGALAFVMGLVGLFFWLQRRGLFSTTAGIARRLRLPAAWVNLVEHGTSSLDAHIREFLTHRGGDVALSITSHLVGLLIGTLQVYILLGWLGLPADAVTCVAVESVAVLIQVVAFLVPGLIGVQEGGKVLVFTALGLPAQAGLSVGIAFRLTQIAGITLGLMAFAFLHWRKRSLRDEACSLPDGVPVPRSTPLSSEDPR